MIRAKRPRPGGHLVGDKSPSRIDARCSLLEPPCDWRHGTLERQTWASSCTARERRYSRLARRQIAGGRVGVRRFSSSAACSRCTATPRTLARLGGIDVLPLVIAGCSPMYMKGEPALQALAAVQGRLAEWRRIRPFRLYGKGCNQRTAQAATSLTTSKQASL